jgi:hypothetical protein
MIIRSEETVTKTTKSLRSALLWTAVVIAAFFAADSVLFRTGWYFNFIEPASSAGQLESHLHWLQQSTPGEREVLVVGDSHIAEGFSVPIATEAANARFRFWNFGIPGSTPRVWFYALRTADPSRTRFAAIVIALEQYADDDYDNWADREIDLNFVIGRLSPLDCFAFSRSFTTPAYQERALVGCLFRGVTLRSDIAAFLHGIRRRIETHRDWFANGLQYITEYGGKAEDLSGMSVDFATRTIRFPAVATNAQRASVIAAILRQPAVQTGETTRYRNQWLGSILDLYRNSSTHIIFVQLPRTPVHLPSRGVPARFLEAALQRPHVSAMPANSFQDMETPELFADGQHLNRRGRPEFSRQIAQFVQQAIGDH